MAEQKINLNNFKSSGVYTVEIDQSENVVLPLTTGRLVVGSSRVGPFNTVVLINDLRTLRAVFGEVDPKLEKAGSFFHRTIEVALREGPIFALNVVPLDDVTDTASFTTFNTEASSNNNAVGPLDYAATSFFNRQALWYADAEKLTDSKNIALGDAPTSPTFGSNSATSNKILSFVNIGNTNATIWVRKADIKGYDVTAKEWFSTIGGSAIEFPSFVHNDDFISDYFVEVIMVNGDWSNYLKLSKDPIYKSFFDESGLKSSKSADFFALREIKVINRTIGCLIPEFRDQSGNTVSIDKILNRSFPTTGILCSLDTDKLDLVDLTVGSFVDQEVETHRVDIVGHGYDELNLLDDYTADNGGYDVDDSVADPTPLIDTLSYTRPADKNLIFLIDNNPSINTLDEIDFLAGFNDTPGTNPVANGEVYLVTPAVGETYLTAIQGSALYKAYTKGFLKTGDVITDGTNTLYLKVIDNLTVTSTVPTTVEHAYIKVLAFSDITLTTQESFDAVTEYGCYTGTDALDYLKVTIASGSEFKYTFDLTDTDFFTSYTVQQPNKLVLEYNITNLTEKAIIDEFIKVNQYIKAKTTSGRTRLLKIIEVKTLSGVTTVTTMSPSTDEVIGLDVTGNTLQVYKGIYNFANTLKGQYVKGFKIQDSALPNGTAERVGGENGILSYLFSSTAIPQALASGELVDFRYVVDSYAGEISASSKYYLAKIAALHGQAMAILNSPSIQQFEKSVDPSFINPTTKLISAEYISQGGNLSLNPQFTFKFAEEDVNGVPLSSYAMYSFPNLIVRSGNKNISVPPAGYVSNLYVRKFKNGTPFLIVAGGKRGAISDPEVVGLEYDLTDEDRDFLEPVGHNLIVKRRGFGIILFSNNTAYQRINSALNNAHVRDNLSTIEKDIEKILFNFLFDFNDEITRLRVKTIVQNYLDSVVAARGLSSYDIVFDSSNNTESVISANTAIIDIKVDFLRGIHKFINRITITRVGGELSSDTTGFIPSF